MGPTWGQHGANLGTTEPRWAPCWPHEPCNPGGPLEGNASVTDGPPSQKASIDGFLVLREQAFE